MMASTWKQTHDHLDSGKDQEKNISTIEPGSNVSVRSRKRKASGDREDNKKKQRGSSNSNTCQRGNVSMEDVRGGLSKRKASPDRESSRKRHRGSCNTTETSKPGKRKASTDPGTPEKRHRQGASTNISEPKEVLVEDVKAEQRKASTGGETSKKRQKDSELCQKTCSSSSAVHENTLPKVTTSRADYEAKYQQHNKIGEGGFGSVFAGVRITDSLPVAIKHIKDPEVDRELKENKIPLEVALMQQVSGGPESVGKCVAVSLLDWYYLDKELILVMERPLDCRNLFQYIRVKGNILQEHDAKIFLTQLVGAAIEMHRKGVFHRDLKMANILVDVSSTVPRLRIIDFGCGTFVRKKPHRAFSGTVTLAPPEWHQCRKYRAAPTTVWQLGGLLYRLLHNVIFTTGKFMSGQLQISSTLSQDCRDFLQLCLATDPKERGTLRQLRDHPWLK